MRQIRLAVGVAAAVLLAGCVEQDPAAIESGHVIAAWPVNQAAENTGAGGVAGVIVGTAAGAVIGGRGAAQVVGAIVGAAVGAAAGSGVESASEPTTGIAYTIRLNDGRVITVMEHHADADPVYAVGSSVAVETRGRIQHVVPAGDGK